MKMTVLLMIDTDKEENVTVQAYSKASANIYVTAATMDKAQALLTTGRQQAEEAMASWTPEQEEAAPAPADQKPQKHYVFYTGRSIEEMEEAALAYEDTTAGRRFVASIENAKQFYYKHSKGGLLMMQLSYLADIHRNSLLNGSMDLTALAYRRGYKEGQKKAAGKKK